MSELDDDIARIAALRGRKVEEVMAGEVQRRREERRVHVDRVLDIFDPGYQQVDVTVADELPDRARAFLTTLPLQASAALFMDLVARHGETDAIAAVRHFLPDAVRSWLARHYGRFPGHPGPCADPTCARRRRPRLVLSA